MTERSPTRVRAFSMVRSAHLCVGPAVGVRRKQVEVVVDPEELAGGGRLDDALQLALRQPVEHDRRVVALRPHQTVGATWVQQVEQACSLTASEEERHVTWRRRRRWCLRGGRCQQIIVARREARSDGEECDGGEGEVDFAASALVAPQRRLVRHHKRLVDEGERAGRQRQQRRAHVQRGAARSRPSQPASAVLSRAWPGRTQVRDDDVRLRRPLSTCSAATVIVLRHVSPLLIGCRRRRPPLPERFRAGQSDGVAQREDEIRPRHAAGETLDDDAERVDSDDVVHRRQLHVGTCVAAAVGRPAVTRVATVVPPDGGRSSHAVDGRCPVGKLQVTSERVRGEHANEHLRNRTSKTKLRL